MEIKNLIGTAESEILEFKEMELLFKGRTDKAELHSNLTKYLEETFNLDKLSEVFPEKEEFPMYPSVILFGEGYGPKIQKGDNYRKDISFRLFDVYIKDQENPLGGWWLEPENVEDIAIKLGIQTAPVLPTMPTREIVLYVKARKHSIVSSLDGGNPDYVMEGVVARTRPLMFTRRGKRVMWKLKLKDFPKEIIT